MRQRRMRFAELWTLLMVVVVVVVVAGCGTTEDVGSDPATVPPTEVGYSATTVPLDVIGSTIPCVGERMASSFDFPADKPGHPTIEEAVDNWTFDGGAPYLRADLRSIVDVETGRAALVDADGNLRILLRASDSGNGWLVDSSERCLDR